MTLAIDRRILKGRARVTVELIEPWLCRERKDDGHDTRLPPSAVDAKLKAFALKHACPNLHPWEKYYAALDHKQ